MQLNGTFYFVLILVVPVDKGSNVPSASLPPRMETTSPDLQLAVEATGIQPEQTAAPFCLISQKNPTRWQALRITIRN